MHHKRVKILYRTLKVSTKDTEGNTRTVGQHNIIELNGKRYDAVTGAFLGVAGAKPHVPGTPVSQRGRVIDGFIRKPQATGTTTVVKPTASAPHHATKAAPAKHVAKTTEPVKKVAHKAGHPIKHIKPHQPERPKTLMRHAVHKPHVNMKPAIKTQSTSGIAARPVSEIAIPLEKKLSVTQVNPVRLARAQHVAKSHHVRRFAQQRQATPQVAAMPVQPAPGAHHRTQTQQTTQTPAAVPVRPVRTTSVTGRPAARTQYAPVRTAAPARTAAIQKDKPADVFEAAIAHARSHEQPAPKLSKRSNRILNWAAGFGAFLLIASFVAYLNMNTIELRIASVRAGFSAQMPSYQPTGYTLGPVKAQKGKVSLSFRSGASTYNITQEASDWDSQTLYDNYVATTGNPETVESKGRTIYIYNGNNATWVNGGVRYEINGNNASLSSDELVALATSM